MGNPDNFNGEVLQKVVVLNSKGGENIETLAQDNDARPLTMHVSRLINVTSFATNTTKGSYTVELSAGHGASVGDFLVIWQDVNLGGRIVPFWQETEVLNVSVNTITIDIPIMFDFTTDAIVDVKDFNLAVDGSVTPVEFSFEPKTSASFDITLFIQTMLHTAASDDSKFGDLSSLANGVVFGKKNPLNVTDFYFFNAKNNADFKAHGSNVDYNDKAGGGLNGTDVSLPINEKFGVVARIEGAFNEKIVFIVRDNLSTLTRIESTVNGHEVIA